MKNLLRIAVILGLIWFAWYAINYWADNTIVKPPFKPPFDKLYQEPLKTQPPIVKDCDPECFKG